MAAFAIKDKLILEVDLDILLNNLQYTKIT